MPDKPEDTESPEGDASRLHYLLQMRLQRLLRIKEALRDDCRPVPPELNEQIQEARKALGADR